MAQLELFTFTETAQFLGVDSNTLNQLIQAGKLQPVKNESGCRFKKSDVENLRKDPQKTSQPQISSQLQPLIQPQSQPPKRYSWDDVLRELQMEDRQLKELVEEGEIQVYLEQGIKKFDRDEIERYKNAKQVEMTIVVEKNTSSNDDIFVVDEEVPPAKKIETITKSEPPKSIPSSPPTTKYEPAKISPLPTTNPPNLAESSKLPTPTVSPQEDKFYSQDDVLTKLQIEVEQLHKMLDEGELSAIPDPKTGKLRFKKIEIDFIRNCKMVDATMVVESARSSGPQESDLMMIVDERSGMDDAPEPLPVKTSSQKIEPVKTIAPPSPSKPVIPPPIPSKPVATPIVSPKPLPPPIPTKSVMPPPIPVKPVVPLAPAKPSIPTKPLITPIQPVEIVDEEIIEAIVIEDDESPVNAISTVEPKVEPTVILPDFGEEDEDNKNLEKTVPTGIEIQPDLVIPQTHSETPSEKLGDDKPFYTFAESAQVLGVSIDFVKIWITKLKISPYIQNNDRKIKRSDLLLLKNAIIQQNQDAPPPQNIPTPQPPPIQKNIPVPAPTTDKSKNDLCILEEAQKLLQVDQQTLKIMVAKGQLVAQKIGDKYYFNRQVVMNLVAQKTAGAASKNVPVPAIAKPASTVAKPSILAPAVAKPVPMATKSNIPAPTVAKPNLSTPTISKTNVPVPTAKANTPISTVAKPNISAVAKPIVEETYTMDEVAKILSIGKNDVKRLVDEKHLTLLPGGVIRKSELDGLKKRGDVEITMVLPLSSDQAEEDDAPVIISAPKSVSSASKIMPSSPPKSPIPAKPAVNASLASKSPTTIKPTVTQPVKPNITQPAKPSLPTTHPGIATKPASSSSSNVVNFKDYYTLQQTLIELQLESTEIGQMVKSGSLKCINYQGTQYFRKQEIDELKKGKMIEPTILMGEGDAIIQEE